MNQSNKPEQYKRGWVEFYKLKFKVTPDVLIPRPETELLVDEALDSIKYNVSSIKGERITILDVGTGAGNIAISLALHLPGGRVNIIATDISQKALKIARLNAKFHRVENKVTFIKSDLLSNPSILYTKNSILIIVTNLPYVPSSRIPYLDPSVKDFEPHLALDGGKDGFELYRKLFTQIKKKILKPDLIIGEIDYTQDELAAIEAQKCFPRSQIEVKTDLAHKQRILVIDSTGWGALAK